MVEPTDIEKKSLEAHVELCAERYNALENKLEHVESKISRLETVMQEVHEMVHAMAQKRNDQIISWGIGIIGVLAAAVGYLITHYVFR
jgi:predicted RNase H-like nuclease